MVPFGAAASPDLTIPPVFLAAAAAGAGAAIARRARSRQPCWSWSAVWLLARWS